MVAFFDPWSSLDILKHDEWSVPRFHWVHYLEALAGSEKVNADQEAAAEDSNSAPLTPPQPVQEQELDVLTIMPDDGTVHIFGIKVSHSLEPLASILSNFVCQNLVSTPRHAVKMFPIGVLANALSNDELGFFDRKLALSPVVPRSADLSKDGLKSNESIAFVLGQNTMGSLMTFTLNLKNLLSLQSVDQCIAPKHRLAGHIRDVNNFERHCNKPFLLSVSDERVLVWKIKVWSPAFIIASRYSQAAQDLDSTVQLCATYRPGIPLKLLRWIPTSTIGMLS
jgi:hypothetical protein